MYRFKEIITAGAEVPFYNTARQPNKKQGASFGYGKKVGDYKKTYSPGPAKYDIANLSFRSNSKPSKNGKFGVGYDKFYLVSSIKISLINRLEILIRVSKYLTIEIYQHQMHTNQTSN